MSSELLRLAELIHVLHEQTERGVIEWKPVHRTAAHDAFQYDGSSASVLIKSRDGDSAPPVAITVFDSNGTVVDDVVVNRTQHILGAEGMAVARELESLYGLIQRRHVKGDSVIRNFIEELRREG